MTDKEQPFVLLRYEDRDTADMICEWLVKTFPYCKDGHARVEEREPEKYARGRFCILMDAYMKQFSTTREKATTAASDFLEGYRRAMEKAQKIVDDLWRAKLKSKATRDRYEDKATIKPIKWNDPVGKAAGIKCKRVGVNGYGEYFLYRWDYDGSGWTRLYGDVDEALAAPQNLPEPPEEYVLCGS